MTRQAARWSPSAGIFGPTTGLDPLLFDGQGRLRSEVRAALLERMDRCVRVDYQVAGSDWEEWLHLWLAGGSASEWSGGRPNEPGSDLDVLVGLDLEKAHGYSSFQQMGPGEAAAKLNDAFRRCFNEQGWQAPFGGTWDLTAYCNPAIGSDIAVIRPYAAYDLTDGRWSVRPPHLPAHTMADFDPAVIAQARAVAAEARAVLALPEPLRTREATALWERVHTGRDAAFSPSGGGWSDPGNVTEKWLAYAPRHLLEKVKELALAPKTAAKETLDHDDPNKVYLRFGHWPANERSHNYAMGWDEEGVSAYDLDRHGDPMDPDPSGSSRHHFHDESCEPDCDLDWMNENYGETSPEGRVTRAERARYHGRDNDSDTGHLVKGEFVGFGHDAEPLLRNVRRVGDWIDHRHLFLDQAGPHRLAREPEDEDYEEPEEHPPYHYRTRHQGAREDQLAAMDPRTRATALAQEQVRFHHPRLMMPLDVKNGQSSEVLSSWLREHGHPRADEAYVAAHPRPGDMHSNTGRGPDGEPVAVLHPERWDYGTLAHEAAHIITDHQTGRQFGEPHGPEGAHGSQWAKNYANLLGRISKPAAGHFISLYKQGRPAGGWGDEQPKRPPQPQLEPATPGLIYLSVPHGALHALPEGMRPRQVTATGDHHITVAHLPRRTTDEEHEAVLRHAEKVSSVHPPLEGTLGGMETFPHGAGAETRRIAYVPANIPGLDRLHADLSAVNVSPHHEFKPHATVAYLRKGQGNPDPHPEVPVRFTHLHVERDGKVTSFPLTGGQRTGSRPEQEPSWAEEPPGDIDEGTSTYGGMYIEHPDDTPWHDERAMSRARFERGTVHPDADLSTVQSWLTKENLDYLDRNRDKLYDENEPTEILRDHATGRDIVLNGNHKITVARERRLTRPMPAMYAHVNEHRTAATGYTDLKPRSGMIYLDLPPGTVRQVPGGVDDHHVTVVYLGSDVSDEAFQETVRRAKAAAAKFGPMEGVLRGIDIFPPSGSSKGKVPAFVPAYIGGIGALRRELEDLSASEHGDYRPHVTLAYMEEGDSLPAPHPAVPVRFGRIHVMRGDDVVSFPLTGTRGRDTSEETR